MSLTTMSARSSRTASAPCALRAAPLLRRPGAGAGAAGAQLRRAAPLLPAARAAAGGGGGGHDDGGVTGDSKGEAQSSFEDLFAQELKRRGIDEAGGDAPSSPSSQPAAAAAPRARGAGPSPPAAAASDPFGGGARPFSPPASRSGPRDETRRPRGAAAGPADGAADGGMDGQRERSMRLVSEGLDGLLPRAKQLLLLGGSIFLGFLPAMLIFSLVFTGVFSVFGENFVHGGRQGALPTYMDPEELLAAPTVDRFVPFRPDDGF